MICATLRAFGRWQRVVDESCEEVVIASFGDDPDRDLWNICIEGEMIGTNLIYVS